MTNRFAKFRQNLEEKKNTKVPKEFKVGDVLTDSEGVKYTIKNIVITDTSKAKPNVIITYSFFNKKYKAQGQESDYLNDFMHIIRQ